MTTAAMTAACCPARAVLIQMPQARNLAVQYKQWPRNIDDAHEPSNGPVHVEPENGKTISVLVPQHAIAMNSDRTVVSC
jgi:hypothetical protein